MVNSAAVQCRLPNRGEERSKDTEGAGGIFRGERRSQAQTPGWCNEEEDVVIVADPAAMAGRSGVLHKQAPWLRTTGLQ